MAKSNNTNTLVSILGFVGKKFDLKSGSGVDVIRFSVGVSRYVSGSSENETDWFQVVAFGKTASFINTYVGVGDLLNIHGSLSTSSYTSKSGEKVYSVNILAQKVTVARQKYKESNNNSYDNSYDDDDYEPTF